MRENLTKFFLLFFFFYGFACYGQLNRPASYVDGVAGLDAFFKEHMNLKPFDLDRNYRGTVIIRQHVDFLGRIDSMYIWFSPSKEMGKEALRVMEETRYSWNPARKNGAFSDSWVQYSYHICRDDYCGYTTEVYEQYKRKSIKAFLAGDKAGGIENLRKAIYAEPTHGEDFYQLAKMLIEEGGDPEICAYLEIAQELSGNLYSEYLDHCGEPGEQYIQSLNAARDMEGSSGAPFEMQPEEEEWKATFPGDRPAIDDRYPGGASSLRRFLAENFGLPKMSLMDVDGGLSVASITISPEGLIEEVAVLNPLGSWIDDQTFRLLHKTRGRWKAVTPFSESQNFVIQVNYTYKPGCERDDHHHLHNDTTLREIVICGVDHNEQYQSNDLIRKKAGELFALDRFPEALPYYFELISRDPFNAFYQEQIANSYQALGWRQKEEQIREKLERFQGGDSMVFLEGRKATGSRCIVQPLENGGYSLREIRLDSSIVYSGKLSLLNPEIRNGTFYFYGEEGRVKASTYYRDNYPLGTWNFYNTKGKLEKSLNYTSVFEYLAREQAYPYIDSVHMGRAEIGADHKGTFSFVEKMPRFRSRDPEYAFANYLRQATEYPAYAQYHGIEGAVQVQFIVGPDGRVREPAVISSVHPDLDLEALRMIISSPRWTPGKIGGVPVGVVYTFPVEFRQYGL